MLVVVYDSNLHAIAGEFAVNRMLRGFIDEIISQTIKETTSPEKALRDYFEGTEICSALKIDDPKRYKTQIPLQQIRELVPNFMPPQGYIFLRKDDKKLAPLVDMIMKLRQE